MKLTEKIRESYQSIPNPVRFFLKRVLILFICWKIIYHLFMLPVRFPDEILTNSTTKITAAVFQLIYPKEVISIYQMKDYSRYDEGIDHARILKNGKNIVGVTDGCNGLELYVLFAGFLFCIPQAKKKRIAVFFILGLSILFVMNIARMVALGQLHLLYKEYFDIAHHYVFKIIMYGLVFFMWMIFVKKTGLSNEEST